MKPIFLVLMLLVLVSASCTNKKDVQQAQSTSEFLSRDEVIEQMNAFTQQDQMDGPLSEDQKERESNLIPAEKLLEDLPLSPELLEEESFSEDVPKSVDLRFRDSVIRSQDNGKCTSFAGVAAISNMLNKDSKVKHELSAWHAWSFYKKYSAQAFINAMTKNRVGDEKDFPQYGKAKSTLKPHAMITEPRYVGENQTEMIRALAKGQVVYIAMETPKSMLKCDKVISPFTAPANGGHALLVVGYYLDQDGKPIAILRNSWGTNCGDKGYQYFPMSICNKSGFYCAMWVIEAVDSSLAKDSDSEIPAPAPTPEVPKFKKVCKRIWYSPWKETCVNVPI